jgi:hypothetical protein
MSDVALLLHPTGPADVVVVHRIRTVDRIDARLHGHGLDLRLAAGTPPEADAALTLRARRLLGREERKRIARDLRTLLRRAGRPPCAPADLALARTPVVHAATLINTLADRLEATEPVGVQGVALARLLIADRGSPVYSRGAESSAVAKAVQQALDAVPACTPVVSD